ncbi:MAG: ribosomal protein S18-alanine N-acetyltransferase [Pseudomonadota bacterium]
MMWPFRGRSLEDLSIETLTTSHAQAMADIHAATFKPAWTDGEFFDLLDNANVGGVALMEQATKGGAMLGFALVRVADEEAEILTIAVTPNWQNYGVGQRLMLAVLANLHADRVSKLFLEVGEDNKSAVALYKRVGFEQVAIRKNYYNLGEGKKSHALVMSRDVG